MTDTAGAWFQGEGGVGNVEGEDVAAVSARLPQRGARRARRDLDERALHEAVRTYGYDARRICEHFGISRRHLQRWFSVNMPSTPGAWLSELRIQHARRLLTTASSVKEVAYGLGFKQASQFSRDFKRRFGHQPSVAKRQARDSSLLSVMPPMESNVQSLAVA